MKRAPLCGLIMAVILTSVSGARGESLGVTEGKLAPCPDSPNCVSTQSQGKRHAMKPLPFLQTREASTGNSEQPYFVSWTMWNFFWMRPTALSTSDLRHG